MLAVVLWRRGLDTMPTSLLERVREADIVLFLALCVFIYAGLSLSVVRPTLPRSAESRRRFQLARLRFPSQHRAAWWDLGTESAQPITGDLRSLGQCPEPSDLNRCGGEPIGRRRRRGF